MLLPINLVGPTLLNVKCLMVESKLDRKRSHIVNRSGADQNGYAKYIVLLRTRRPEINTKNGEGSIPKTHGGRAQESH